MMTERPVLVLAASARPLARSLVRAGHAVRCYDFFADLDTPHVMKTDATAGAVEDEPPDRPLIYGGAFENRPEVLERIARRRPLLGCPPVAIHGVRAGLFALAAELGLRVPQEQPNGTLPPAGDRLWKPFASAAGQRIGLRPLDGVAGRWQERIDGASVGAAFVAREGECVPLGLVRHHPNPTQRDPAQPFAMQDLTHDPAKAIPQPLVELAAAAVARFGLRGPFNIDAILTPDGPVPLECNPRYTSGMELIERAAEQSVFDASFGEIVLRQPRRCWAKRILLAHRAMRSRLSLSSRPGDWVADIPPPGTLVDAGQPWCTVFAEAGDAADSRTQLDARRRLLEADFADPV